ncbi:MAG: ABC transporter ATP-binding protein [Clostridia bacterium]
MSQTILQLKNITKVYPGGVVANKGVSFDLRDGEIHALVGENGAGKSTLMKVLFGMEKANSGEIILNGEKVEINDPNHAIDLGIGMVHQHFMLVPSFTVTQNLQLGMEQTKGIFIDKKKAREITLNLAQKYNFAVNPDKKVSEINVAMKQKVEILKVLLRGAKILILDEPTAVLTPQETEELFAQLRLLKDIGHSIIFISHKLKEVKEISDRVSVLRDGKMQKTLDTKDVDERDISKLMVGRDIPRWQINHNFEFKNPKFSVRNLSFEFEGKQILNNISFDVFNGQILGIAGVEGNGQVELVKLITKSLLFSKGDILIDNKSIKNMDVSQLRKQGLSYIPEDRMDKGVAAEALVEENIVADRIILDKFSKKGFLDTKRITQTASDLIKEYSVKTSGPKEKIKSLSGGNIQKVVVARESSLNTKVLIAEQPTRGVDIGSIEFIHNQLIKLRDNNKAILLVSADLEEILKLSDQILVMFEGEVVAFYDNDESLSEEKLGLAMLGIERQSEQELRRAISNE